jgi:DNA gyrase subunit A
MKEFFKDVDKDTVEMVDSYDGTLKEPKLLPVTFPSILTNSQSGTAVGMASNFASFNLEEVIDYTIAYIGNPKSTNISDYILAPDMSTGGSIVYNKEVFESIFNTGRGSFDIRANYKIEKNSIIFDEAPYNTTFEAITEKIVALDIDGIDSKGIEITVKNNTDKEKLVAKLFKATPLQSAFGCNFNMVVNGRPQVLGIKQIVHEWLAFRATVIKRGLSSEMQRKADKKHTLLALKQVLLDVDRAIKIIRETKTNSEVVSNLVDAFDIDKVQAEYVAEIKLRHLNEEYLIQRVAEIETLEAEIIDLGDLIENRKRLAKLIVGQLKEVKKNYGKERKSKIVQANELSLVEKETIEIDNYNVKVFVSKEGYLKKIPLTSLRGGFAIKVKEGDEIIGEFETTNNSDILVFTDMQNVYKLKSYDLEDHKPSVLGEYLPSFLELKDEKILFTTVTNDYKGDLIVGFEDGKVAKIELSAYETKQNRSMLKNAYADKKALYFNHIHEDVDILAISSIDKALLFNTSMINSKTSKTTIGVQVQKSKNDSYVTAYHNIDDSYSESGYYRTANAGVGKYLRKEDFEAILNK